MDKVLQKITEWLKEILVGGVMGNLSGMFDSVNQQVGEIGEQVSLTPAEFSPEVFSLLLWAACAGGAASTCWRCIVGTTPARMPMCRKVTHKNLIDNRLTILF